MLLGTSTWTPSKATPKRLSDVLTLVKTLPSKGPFRGLSFVQFSLGIVMKKQRGFTLFELIAVLCVLFWVGVVCTLLYAAAHFIAKFW